MKSLCLNKSSLDFSPSPEPAPVTSSNSYMGKFIKLLDTLTQDTYSKLHMGKQWVSNAKFVKNVLFLFLFLMLSGHAVS